MALEPEPTVPHMLRDVLAGLDGGSVMAALPGVDASADLVVQAGDRRSMALVRLDVAGWLALEAMAGKVARRLQNGG